MKDTILSILKYCIGLGLGLVLLWFAFRGVELDKLREALRSADYTWILASVPVALLSHFLRAWRWNMLLEAAGFRPRLANTYASLMVGYMVNQAVPRGGEIARCTPLIRTDKVTMPALIGTVITERVFDVISLLLLVLFFVAMESGRLLKYFHEGAEGMFGQFGAMGTGILVVAALVPLVIVVGFLWYWKHLKKGPLLMKIDTFVRSMLDSARGIFRLKSPARFLAATVAIWTCYGLMTWLAFFSLQQSSGFGLYFAFLLMTMGGIGMSLPSPAGLGPYNYAVKYTVVAFHAAVLGQQAAEELGLAMGTLMQISQIIMLIIAGFIAWIFLFFQKPVDSAIVSSPGK